MWRIRGGSGLIFKYPENQIEQHSQNDTDNDRGNNRKID
jgi:hypothetical protein